MKKLWVAVLALLLVGAMFVMCMAEGLEVIGNDYEPETDEFYEGFEEEAEEEDEFLIGGDASEPEETSDYAESAWEGEDVGEEVVDAYAIAAPSAGNDWSSAYMQFILGDDYKKAYPYSNDLAAWKEQDVEPEAPTFGLYDMNRDGIPELILTNGGPYNAVMSDYAYTYRNGKVEYLGLIRGIYSDFFYFDGSSFPGLFWVGSYGASVSGIDYYYITNGKLKQDQVITWDSKTTIHTKNKTLISLLSDNTKSHMVQRYTVGEIKSIGWDSFAKQQSNEPGPSIEAVELSATELRLAVNKSYTLSATVIPKSKAKSLVFSSSNPRIATVNKKTGKIKAKKAGQATIKVRLSDDYVENCEVTVYKPPKKVSLNKKKMTLSINDGYQLKAKLPAGTWATMTWTSSNPKVATVDKNGLVKAVGKGKATITVKTNNGKKAKCTVTVKGKGEPSELSGYLKSYSGTLNLVKILNLTGVKKYDEDEGAYTCYKNDKLIISVYSDYVWINLLAGSKGKYSVEGVKTTMSAKKAIATLEKRGWVDYEDDEEDFFKFFDSEDDDVREWYVTLDKKNGKIRSLSAAYKW